jgi:WD40 repeat protein
VWEASTGHRLAQLDEHRSWVSSAVFSPDGKLVVTASDDGTARVWEWREATGHTVEELRGHASGVRWAVFSPDGKWVVTTSWDNTARVWEASTGHSLAELRGHTSWVSTAEFSPDGRLVVTAGEDGTARVWQPTGGLLDKGLITYLSQDETGKSLYAMGLDGTVVTVVEGYADAMLLAVSPDRGYLAIALSQDGELGPSTTYPRFIESGSRDSTVSLVVVSADGVESTTVVTDVPAVDAAYTPDGELVVAVLRDSAVTYMLTQENGSDPRELYRSQNVLPTPAPTPAPEATEEAP